MGRTKIVRVDESLITVFGKIGKEFADKIKREYNLKELYVSEVLMSQLIAGNYLGQKSFNFKVRKTGLTTGVLELG